MDTKTFLENFGHIADAPNGVQKLRELVLEMAVKGELVEQISDEGIAQKLVHKIRNRKSGKTTQKKSKRQKLTPLEKSDYPFNLPENWEWLRLEEAAEKITDGEHLSPNKTTSGMPLLTARHVLDSGVTMNEPQYVSQNDGVKFRERCDPQLGDVLICSRGTIGRCSVVNIKDVFCLMGSVILVRPQPELESGYLNYFMKSFDGQLFIRGVTKGMAVNALYLKDIRLCPVPLPPLEEQKRIVAKVDQLMALCDQLETQQKQKAQTRVALNNAALDKLLTAQNPEQFNHHWQRIANNFHHLYDNLDCVKELKSAILQMAAQGKLVSQDKSDRSTQIKFEGKTIENSESLLFDLPQNWGWVELGQLTDLVTSGSRGWKQYYSEQGASFIRSQDIKYDMLEYDNRSYVSLPRKTEGTRTRVFSGDIVITITGGNLAKAALIEEDPGEAYVSQHVALVRLINLEMGPYIHKWLINEKGGRNLLLSSGYGAKPGLNLNNIKKLPIPLPPLEEQKRIVAKVDQLMALSDQLEAKLKKTQTTSEKLVAATVKIIAA